MILGWLMAVCIGFTLSAALCGWLEAEARRKRKMAHT